jgi:hypothetical protein
MGNTLHEVMGLCEQFQTKLEYSLFSFWPDLVIVYHMFLGFVLGIKVQKDPSHNYLWIHDHHNMPPHSQQANKQTRNGRKQLGLGFLME